MKYFFSIIANTIGRKRVLMFSAPTSIGMIVITMFASLGAYEGEWGRGIFTHDYTLNKFFIIF